MQFTKARRVGVEVVFDTVAEKKFVSEHFLRAVKNWLAGNEALPRQRKGVRVSGFLCGSCWFHVFYIGAAVAELQGEPWIGYLRSLGNRVFGNPPMWKTKGTPPLRVRRFRE